MITLSNMDVFECLNWPSWNHLEHKDEAINRL